MHRLSLQPCSACQQRSRRSLLGRNSHASTSYRCQAAAAKGSDGTPDDSPLLRRWEGIYSCYAQLHMVDLYTRLQPILSTAALWTQTPQTQLSAS